jgi:hypothetical protein
MPPFATRERFIDRASLVTLILTISASGAATVIHWRDPVHRAMNLTIPPVTCGCFIGLLVTLLRRPQRVGSIMRYALLCALLALAAPAWFFTWQAAVTPHLRLIDIHRPVAALFLAMMVMVMIYMPARRQHRSLVGVRCGVAGFDPWRDNGAPFPTSSLPCASSCCSACWSPLSSRPRARPCACTTATCCSLPPPAPG